MEGDLKDKELFKERFEYSLYMVAIVCVFALFVFDSIEPLIYPFKQVMSSNWDLFHPSITSFVFTLFLFYADAIMFLFFITCVSIVLIRGIYLSKIFDDKNQEQLCILANRIFSSWFIIVFFTSVFLLFWAIIECIFLFIFWIFPDIYQTPTSITISFFFSYGIPISVLFYRYIHSKLERVLFLFFIFSPFWIYFISLCIPH